MDVVRIVEQVQRDGSDRPLVEVTIKASGEVVG